MNTTLNNDLSAGDFVIGLAVPGNPNYFRRIITGRVLETRGLVRVEIYLGTENGSLETERWWLGPESKLRTIDTLTYQKLQRIYSRLPFNCHSLSAPSVDIDDFLSFLSSLSLKS